MKGFLIFLLCYVAAIAKPASDLVGNVMKCSNQEGLDAASKRELWDGMRNKTTGEPNKKIKCVIACTMESLKLMSPSDFSFNAEAAEERFKYLGKKDGEVLSRALANFKKCANQVKASDRCERAWEHSECSRMQ